MTEKEQLQVLRIALLQIMELRKDFSALKLALARQGQVNRETLQAAEAELQETWNASREAVSKLGQESEPSFDELLRSFEGPIQ